MKRRLQDSDMPACIALIYIETDIHWNPSSFLDSPLRGVVLFFQQEKVRPVRWRISFRCFGYSYEAVSVLASALFVRLQSNSPGSKLARDAIQTHPQLGRSLRPFSPLDSMPRRQGFKFAEKFSGGSHPRIWCHSFVSHFPLVGMLHKLANGCANGNHGGYVLVPSSLE